MTGIVTAAILLAGALVLLPGHPGRRLDWRAPHRDAAAFLRVLLVLTATAAATSLPAATLLAGAVLGATVLHRRRRAQRRHRTAVEGRTLATALELLVAELRRGAHPVRAFESAAADTGDAVGAALGEVAARARLGADVVGGLRAAAEGSSLGAEWERIAVAWQLAAAQGLAISPMMRAAQLDIVERQRFRIKVQADLAGARATTVILAALPLLGVVLGELIGAAPLAFLTGGGAGGWCLVAGTVLAVGGLYWADRIIDGLPA